MGTSHEAPMMRGIEEWNRQPTGTGEWSFRRNADAVKAYWRDGAQRMADQRIEGAITLGMRGNGDTSLPDGAGIDLMSSIIDTQRQILRDTGLIGATQVQTLYKEVQHYWDQGYLPGSAGEPAGAPVTVTPAPDAEGVPGCSAAVTLTSWTGGFTATVRVAAGAAPGPS